MRRGKHSAGWNKSLVLILALALVITAVVGGVVAFMKANTGSVNNSFTSAFVSTQVNEEFDGNTKADVTVENTGTTRAYIRATIVVTWQSEDGSTVFGMPPVAGTDYVITQNNTDWVLGADGFWYYTKPVAADHETGNLIDSLMLGENANVPDGYSLHVEILSSGIQSIPDTTVEDMWSNDKTTVTVGTGDVLSITDTVTP